jgi:hypothetical protein
MYTKIKCKLKINRIGWGGTEGLMLTKKTINNTANVRCNYLQYPNKNQYPLMFKMQIYIFKTSFSLNKSQKNVASIGGTLSKQCSAVFLQNITLHLILTKQQKFISSLRPRFMQKKILLKRVSNLLMILRIFL